LGAGFDCRAWRLLPREAGVTFFEVDHPATQRKKRERMQYEIGSRVRFLPWNFEKDPLPALGDRLADLGLDRDEKTMILIEGVIVYLSQEAIAATFDCARHLGAVGSRVTFTYSAAELLTSDAPEVRRERRLVRLIGEPFRSGFAPGQLEPWLASRGFRLVQDESFDAIARRLLSPERAARLRRSELRRLRFCGVAERVA
jgi:methyltransferase (TIGR00027 family)